MPDDPLGYSEDALTRDLRAWWDEQVGGADDPFAEPARSRPAGTIFDVIPEIDSYGALEGLLIAERHLGVEIPPRLIQRGGYRSFDEMAGDLLPKLRREALKHRSRERAA